MNQTLREEARNLRLKKRFSQNFLVDEQVLNRIVQALHLEPIDTVVEIGAGAGFLTQKLFPQAKQVIAVELERKMCRYLRQKFSATSNLTLIEQDILKTRLDELAEPRFKVVGNLPYNITTPILFHLGGELSDLHWPLRQRMSQVTLMVQKEVGQRVTASPGQKAYNQLSIALQVWFETRLEFIVPPQAFYPPPKVDSSVITLIPRQQPLIEPALIPEFARLVKGAFSQKRKTLNNALRHAQYAPPDVLDTMWKTAGIDPQQRAEALSIEDFGKLAHAYRSNTRQD